MKKVLIVLIAVFGTLFAISAILIGYFWWQNRASEKKATVSPDQKVFESRVYNFKISYPKKLFIISGEVGATLIAKIRLADFEKPEAKPADNSVFDVFVFDDQPAKDCKAIKDCQVVKDLEGQKFTVKSSTLDGVEAVTMTNLEKMGTTVVSTLALSDGKIYRLDFSPSTITAYENSKSTYESILSGFKFLETSETAWLGAEKAHAATSCVSVDQQYAPGSTLTREPLRTSNDTGQTFQPTKTSICKLAVELESVDANQTATIWLYTSAGALLAQKTQSISDGWNTFTLDSPVAVTPDGVYKIQININGGAGANRNLWKAGETGLSDGYARGHAIIAGFDENDLDFHFKEYYSETTDDGGGGGTDPGTGTTGGQPKAKSATKTTAPATVKDTTPPKKPFNLNIIKLWLTGLTQTYVDLQWDKVTDEDLDGYLIYYGEKSGDYYYTIDNGTANTIRIKNLLPGGTYYFAARAYDKSGNVSERSNEVSANLLRNIIISYWWILLILGGLLIAAVAYYLVLKKKEARGATF